MCSSSALRVGSPVHLSTGSTLPCCPGESQGTFSPNAASGEGLGQVPHLLQWRGKRGGGYLFLTRATTWHTIKPPTSAGSSLLQKCLCPQNILFLSLIPDHTFAYQSSTHLSGAARCQVGPCFLLGAQGRPYQACVWVSLSHSIRHGTGQDHASLSERDHNSAQQH